MESRKLTKQDIDKVRDIEGFPIADDEDIIALSDVPYYTACPNPFIKDFVEEYGTFYSEKENYSITPYTEDIAEGKHDPIYNVHSYHTKVPPKAIMTYIEHYTKPGDLILDVFAGSGMTGVAAQLCPSGHRNAILVDLSPYATFLEANYNTPNQDNTIAEIEKIIDQVDEEIKECYETIHVIDGEIQYGIHGEPIKGIVDYTVWSDVFYCPHCGHEMIFYNTALEKGTRKTLKKFKCEKCNYELSKTNIILKKSQDIDEQGHIYEYAQKVPVLINYSIGKTRYSKVPDERDLELLKSFLVSDWVPCDELPNGYNTEQPKHSHGMKRVNSFYTKRAQFVLGKLYNVFKTDSKKLFLFTSVLPKLTFLNRYMPEYDDKEHKYRALVGPMAGTYYVPSLSVEHNVVKQFKFQLGKLRHLKYKKSPVLVSTQSATDLSNIPDNSIDYVFIDPPFGANIMYSELNFMPESWLKIKTTNQDEAIINTVQKKTLSEYINLMTESFKEIFRVIKPNHWVTIEFHNSMNAVWNGIQHSIQAAGFVIADVRIINKKKKTVMQHKSDNTVDMDLAISVYKPKENLDRLMRESYGTEESVWRFVFQHLEKLPVIVDADKDGRIDIVQERQSRMLFDRMVAYHIMHGIPVPLGATDFYAGLNERFLFRDGMYFLPNQVNEYDMARIKMDIAPMQFSLFVTNEKTAISWLYQQLSDEFGGPKTYAELQPEFMKIVKVVDKYESIPELSVLLEESFLMDEKSRWYIPDVSKEGDVGKLREKKLLKEFDGYMASEGKLRLFRSEAIRVGFSKLWKEKNYQAIVDLAERLPEQTVQEDPNILMYYDISLSRV